MEHIGRDNFIPFVKRLRAAAINNRFSKTSLPESALQNLCKVVEGGPGLDEGLVGNAPIAALSPTHNSTLGSGGASAERAGEGNI